MVHGFAISHNKVSMTMELKELEANAYYDMVAGKPKEKERDNDGSWLYRYNIQPDFETSLDGRNPTQIGWKCRELRLFVEPNYENLKRAIIDSVYSAEARLDLISRYNAYISAIGDDPTIGDEYKSFIQFCRDVDELLNSNKKEPHASQSSVVPRFVTNRQFRLILISRGVKLESITEEINKLPTPYKEQALVSWEYSPTFERANPMVQQLAQKFGFDDVALDNLFIEADKL